MSLTKTQATSKCGASISTAFTSELTNWLWQHQQCLISQPKREWVGLTDEEIELLNDCGDTDSYKFAKAIEDRLKEKNT